MSRVPSDVPSASNTTKWMEATGAILFGLFLGLLALRSRSIWGGFLVHAGVAVTIADISFIVNY